jgi:hypothetical protein
MAGDLGAVQPSAEREARTEAEPLSLVDEVIA